MGNITIIIANNSRHGDGKGGSLFFSVVVINETVIHLIIFFWWVPFHYIWEQTKRKWNDSLQVSQIGWSNACEINTK